ncbi:MAG TPA: hypothetical protein VFC51_19630 [Chloroflexota bacterium]|nr:hypothetical protein [Chloroflexota bacterium]
MGRLLTALVVLGLGWLVVDRRARQEATELLRDLSDSAIMLLLRSTSGFASDVPEPIQREEQERRTRWR